MGGYQLQHRANSIRVTSNHRGNPPSKDLEDKNTAKTPQTNNSNDQNAAPPKRPQNRWRMPDERMELMCQYLAQAGKEKQAQDNHSRNNSHCTQHCVLPPDQMNSLVNLLTKIIKSRHQLYGNISFSRHDWNAITHAINKRYGGNTRSSVLECAMRAERYKYVIALFREAV
ncbi:MAG: hypothetical protein ALECFALPRED_000622 [Alectoria fallacina]|uniref:Myb/SANT-like domain-containing protein n=1 Tax=Alectoria fallacina TaxID=1903189 RepID=A0A8H3HWL7_9LECA|nr:MAG: hypothetical protein ALECFALPRED_000622 [Alectoria fallacina]